MHHKKERSPTRYLTMTQESDVRNNFSPHRSASDIPKIYTIANAESTITFFTCAICKHPLSHPRNYLCDSCPSLSNPGLIIVGYAASRSTAAALLLSITSARLILGLCISPSSPKLTEPVWSFLVLPFPTSCLGVVQFSAAR